ncbi:MAG: 50S ribosomal protein L28 [Caldilineae bacterium]|nr:50S ribosomal protein L28 [Anaerolineae bacterium]MCB0203530.1 50S ribosomal protein L28 [Anaerolineae bacterium]MCB0253412.1 50S ribosomal protein L28 [Anaerolineae bacterium]MCB9155407.1 50S ribosomal protein L28 [Caldilineae bacterium]
MAKCQVCGRGPQFGHNVSHSMRHTKRRWNVNVQRTKVVVNGKPQRMAVCTSCIKTLNKTR